MFDSDTFGAAEYAPETFQRAARAGTFGADTFASDTFAPGEFLRPRLGAPPGPPAGTRALLGVGR